MNTTKTHLYDISIVIPYYNQPEQLKIALESLYSQKNIKIEVFVVDDASQIACDDVVDEYKAKGLTLTLLKQETRQYTLKARLRGMKEVSGKYLAFMDSDDYLYADDVYAKIYKEAVESQADILHHRTYYKDQYGEFAIHALASPFHNGVLHDEEIFLEWTRKICPTHTVWSKIYSYELYDKVRNCEHNIPIFRIEDLYLTAYFLFLAKKYVSTNIPVYVYNPPKNPPSTEKLIARSLDAMHMYFDLTKNFEKLGLKKSSAQNLQKYLRELTTLETGRLYKKLLAENSCTNLSLDMIDDHAKQSLEEFEKYGTIEEFNLILIIANASNAKKLLDVYKQSR